MASQAHLALQQPQRGALLADRGRLGRRLMGMGQRLHGEG